MRLTIAVIVLALISWPAFAAEPTMSHIEISASEAVAEASADCALGLVYDDGQFVDFYGASPAYVVMRFDLPVGSNAIDQVCSCFSRDGSGSTSLPYDVVVFDNNGAGGSPGSFLGAVAATATNIPVAGNFDFYNVSLAGSAIALPDRSVYVGVRYNSSNHFVCGDRSAGTPVRAVYNSGDGVSWVNSTTAFSGSGPNAWGIRVDPSVVGTAACTPSSETLCLNGGRFRVTATFETPNSTSGNARAVKLTDETGYFWFFSSSNVEVVVKVLNGCGFNNSYWFFAGGLTNVRTVLTVTDTTTGTVRTYVNPQGTAFQPIQDTSAFSTCP